MSVDEQDQLFSLEGPADEARGTDDSGEGPRPGFRLHRLELLNWGTFDGGVRTFRLDGETSLLTGDIGSGKSTVVDAVTTLLLPAHRIEYNKAAGAQKKERTLMSYVRGFHKSERTAAGDSSKPVALRGPGSFSVVLGVFHNAVLDKTVTLALTLWATQEAGQPNRFYTLAAREQGIAADFADFGGDPAKLKKALRAAGVEVFDTFEKYESAFKRHFGIGSGQAMELFHRTVSMKQVENITQFVRANMLDDDDVEARIANLLHHFDDLKKAHEAVLRAKDQIARLVPVRDGAARHAELAAREARGRAQRDQLQAWFTSKRLGLSLEHQAELARTAERLGRERDERRAEELAVDRELAQIREDLRTHGGGRLAALDAAILDARAAQARQKDKGAVYAAAAGRLGLVDPDERVAFDHNAGLLEGVERGLRERADALNTQLARLTAERGDAAARAQELTEEVRSLSARQNLLPRTQLELRARLCVGTGVPAAALPYAGELLRVRDGESLWEGAAERTLRGFALSLLVPDEHYAAVSSWVDANNLRARLVYLRVADSRSGPAAQAEPGTLGSKIAVKPGTPLREFLLGELARRFDHRCCEDLVDFRRSARAVTPNGQLKTGGGRHEKDDRRDLRDRREYVLGWDNTEKVARLRTELDEAEAGLAALDARMSRTAAGLDELAQGQRDLGNLHSTAFEDIDWRGTSRRIEDLAAEKTQIEEASDVLAALAAKEADAVVRLGRAREKASAVEKRLGANEAEERAIAEAIAECRGILAEHPLTDDAGLAAEIAALAEAVLGDEELTYKNAERAQTRVRERLQGELDALNKRVAAAAEKTINLMAAFRAAYPAETTDFDESLDAAPEYSALLAQLQGNDLPRFEARFKESLNQNTINEVVGFNAFLDARRTVIAARIREINASLAEIEYNPGRHIQLEHQPTTDSDVREFVADLRACSEGTLGAEEQYSEQKFLQVEKLVERFRGRQGLTALDARWTAKVTDVRQWFTFSASEKWTETGEEHEHFTDSGGKSGGQKEKLAYTILAAALAFQFGLAGNRSAERSTAVERGRNPDRSFRFVVIDEAFGRGSDESARYGLELFRRMRLQLLVVTPLQKIHVIEPYVAHVGFVANPTGQDSRLRNMTIQEYREERDRRAG